MADEQKALGNAEFKAGNYEKAIGFFTKAIELGGDHGLFSNRSACYCGLQKYGDALKDAESCIAKAPTWAKVRECSQVCPSQSPPVRAPHHPHIAGFRTQGRGAARHGQVR